MKRVLIDSNFSLENVNGKRKAERRRGTVYHSRAGGRTEDFRISSEELVDLVQILPTICLRIEASSRRVERYWHCSRGTPPYIKSM